MADDPHFLVHLATGPSGPYTAEELRQLLSSGKAAPDDRVQDQSNGLVSTLAKLVPDAAELAKHAAGRVRRRTSDRLQAVGSAAPKPHGHRTPLPAAHTAEALATIEATGRKTARNIGLLVVLIALAVLGGWLSWPIIAGWLRPTPPPPPELVLDGTWTITELPEQGGPWTLTFTGQRVRIAGPGGATSETDIVTDQQGPHAMNIRLPEPHPVFGARIGLVVQHGANWCIYDTGSVRIDRPSP